LLRFIGQILHTASMDVDWSKFACASVLCCEAASDDTHFHRHSMNINRNSDGSFRVKFDSSIASMESPYFSIRHKSTIDDEFELRAGKGIMWMRDFLLYDVDGIALYCDDELVDYLGWVN